MKQEKTAFSTGRDLLQFKVLPFGLCNAPATFERLMDMVPNGLSWSVCLVYLDDIIVHAREFQDELHRLREVFLRLRAANLKLNPKKCQLCRREVSYLGHVITRNGVSIDLETTKAVMEWEWHLSKFHTRYRCLGSRPWCSVIPTTGAKRASHRSSQHSYVKSSRKYLLRNPEGVTCCSFIHRSFSLLPIWPKMYSSIRSFCFAVGIQLQES